MGLIFRGMLFVLLDFELEWNGMSIGLIPDWLGYWWLAKGVSELEEEWTGFRRLRPAALALAGYSALLYGMKLMKLTVRQEFLLWVMELAAAVGTVIAVRLVGRGICHMEKNRGWDLRGGKLQSLWVYLAVLQILGTLFSWMPVVGTCGAAAAFVMGCCYLAVLRESRKHYDQYRA